ncbi:MAG: 2-oxoacid:acceptor oxidoreductase subunit alpha [Chloroflexi bacterium]|nr:2-oxoacid:acceptor oxidoreductase subunit alpha [Chloroflexota bacterium]
MATQTQPASAPGSVVNDFSITVSTVNGTGSQTSNLTIQRAIFKMGIPVSGKNIFPSNIQGLPTWYTLRVSKDGWLARREEHEIVIAMNPATIKDDIEDVMPGGVLFYADHLKLPIQRDDIVMYPMPVKKLSRESDAPKGLRDYVANMVYVGVLAEIIGIELDKIYAALEFHFKGKESPITLNYNVIKAAAEWAKENLEKKDPYRLEPMDATKGYIMADGNTAAALGALYGGVQFVGWYPITPASSLVETMNQYIPKLRKDPKTGKNTVVVIQAEDELAAVGMTIGAGWAGLRSMTSTSGAGISLMSEFIGLAYYAEVPIVIWDVQRGSPSTGLPTRTMQGDITQVAFISQGDTDSIMLFPKDAQEAFEFGWRAFDYAERLQTPIFVMSDLDIGQNQWMVKPFEYPDEPMDRGKVLWEEDLERWEKEGKEWGRYLDVDGDGIPYRTVIGNKHPKAAYFTRGTGHDEFARYSEDPEVWTRVLKRIKKKYETARDILPKPILEGMEGAPFGIIAFGSSHPAVQEARHYLKEEKGIATDYLRLRAYPFSQEVRDFIANHEKVYVVEMNRDGQMRQLLQLEVPEMADRLVSVAKGDGLPLTARWIMNTILEKEEE